jgi:hypothetical protein
MIGRTIILDHLNGREAAALMVDGKLEDLLIASDAPAPGTIYRAIADRPVKGQGGMFLKTPDGNAFLRQIKGMAPGHRLRGRWQSDPGSAPRSLQIALRDCHAECTRHQRIPLYPRRGSTRRDIGRRA